MLAFTGPKAPQVAKPTFMVLVVVLAVSAGVLGAVLVGAIGS